MLEIDPEYPKIDTERLHCAPKQTAPTQKGGLIQKGMIYATYIFCIFFKIYGTRSLLSYFGASPVRHSVLKRGKRNNSWLF